MQPRAELLGLPYDRIAMDDAVARCMEWCTGPRTSHTVITANASIICLMRRDAELARACQAGDLVLADGMSVVWAGRWAGVRFPERVAGVDLLGRLLAAGGERKLSAYFLGAKPEVVRRLAELCAERYPGLTVAGFRDGYFKPADHEAIAEDIREKAPHLLFVGMPSPFKEVWCERYRARLEVPVIMGVGGSFDVHAGYIKRAPRLFQRLGMEWSWRLNMEPRKMWRRYLTTNSEFLWLALREAVARRRARPAGGAGADTSPPGA